MAVRFCENCEQPMTEGHVLYDDYTYCGEECLRADNVGDENIDGVSMEEMYDNDVQYWTEWWESTPEVDVVEVGNQWAIVDNDGNYIPDEDGRTKYDSLDDVRTAYYELEDKTLEEESKAIEKTRKDYEQSKTVVVTLSVQLEVSDAMNVEEVREKLRANIDNNGISELYIEDVKEY